MALRLAAPVGAFCTTPAPRTEVSDHSSHIISTVFSCPRGAASLLPSSAAYIVPSRGSTRTISHAFAAGLAASSNSVAGGRTLPLLRQNLGWQSAGRHSDRRGRQPASPARASDEANGRGAPRKDQEAGQVYGQIERVFSETARRSQAPEPLEEAERWEDIEGSWVVRPRRGAAPHAVVHFLGGVFVGASPQLTYRLFLERLADRGILVVATPFASGFDHLRIADEAQFKFDRCLKAMGTSDPEVASLPVFGVGHSMGALAHLLIGSRYGVQRAGNVLISFNNKDASEAIPLFSPVIAPAARNFAPLLSLLGSNTALQVGAEVALNNLRGLNPGLAKQVLPLVEQLPPLYEDLTAGKLQFTPTPAATRSMAKAYYGVRRNLLIRFESDAIDETPELGVLLNRDAAQSASMAVAVRTLPGDHARPLQQLVPELPQGLADAVTTGSGLLSSLATSVTAGGPFADIARGLTQQFTSTLDTEQIRRTTEQDIQSLVGEITEWIGGLAAPEERWLPSR